MPTFTVAGRLTRDEMRLIITGTYRGSRPDLVPAGGWGHVVKNAVGPAAARAEARRTFEAYTAGTLVYEVEITMESEPQKRRRWPWSRRTDGPTESLGRLPIV